MLKLLVDFLPGLIGALLGSVAGYFVVDWISQQGFYAPVIPGALAGLGCGFLSIRDNRLRGVLCALIAMAGIVVTDWKLITPAAPTDGSLGQFVALLPTRPLTLIMTVLGTFLGFWWGRESTFPWRARFDSADEGR